MIILGLDPSQSCGWAIYDTNAELSAMKAGVLKVHGTRGKFEANAGMLGHAFARLIKEIGKPDFAAIEQAPRQAYGPPKKATGGKMSVVRFMGDVIPAQEGDAEEGGSGGLQSTLSTNQMAAAVSAILGAYKIPYETMTDSDWRKRAYGFGRRTGWKREDWKRQARQMCLQMKIVATNDDMAEACWIAFAGASLPACKLLQNQVRAA